MATPLHRPLCDLLGCTQPIVLAGMGGVARSELVAAVTAAGGFGFLGMVREPPALIRREVEEVRRAGHERFGVNLIPAATPADLLTAELATIIELKVPVVCLFWDVQEAIVRQLRDAGIMVVYQVGSVEAGRAARAAGAQILIAQGVEAGGHVWGTRPLHDLLPELVAAVDVPVLAAGGIVDAEDMVMAMALGAQGVVLGTAMIATRESFAHDFHKERLLAAGSSDTVLTEAFHVNWPPHATVRVLSSDITTGRRGDPQTAERTVIGWEEGRPIYLFSTDSPLRSMTGDFGSMALYAGLGVGRVRKMQPAAAKLDAIVRHAAALLAVPTPAAAEERSSPVCYAGEASPEYMGYLGRPALLERLGGLRTDIATGLEAARRGAAPGHDQSAPGAMLHARWAVILTQLLERLGGTVDFAPVAGEVPLDAADEAALQAARALLPVVAEEDVRAILSALVAALGGTASEKPPLQLWTAGRVVPG